METTERKRLPLAEIEALYPEHWILLDEPEADAWNNIVSGIVVLAHSDKKEFYRRAVDFKLARSALRCTKKDPGRKYVL